MPDDMRDLFSRDIDRIDLPPASLWLPGARSPQRSPWRPVLALSTFAGIVALALAVAFGIQLARGQVPTPVAASPTVNVTAAASASSSPPSRSPSPEPTPSAESSPQPQINGVSLANRLPASGRWAIVVRRRWTYVASASGAIVRSANTTDTLTAVSLDRPSPVGNDTTELLSYASGAEAVPSPSNLLRSQFSPDGRRLVLSVVSGSGTKTHAGLVVVDIVAGRVTALASDDRYNDVMPAWRPNGEQIAFVRSTNGVVPARNDASIWVIGSDGAGMHEVLAASANPPEGTSLFSWNADGTGIGYFRGFETGSYSVLDLATGRSTSIGDRVPLARGLGDWRSSRPSFVGAFASGPHDSSRFISVADGQLGGPTRDLVALPQEGVRNLHDPRWRPGGSELLYVQTTNEPSSLSQLMLTSPGPATLRSLVSIDSLFLLAAWTGDGRQLVYAYGNGSAEEIHVMYADGTGDRVIGAVRGSVVPEAPVEWPDLAVLSL